MPAEIRRAQPADAEGISRTIVRAIEISNAVDYPPHVITAVVKNFTPPHVLMHLAERHVVAAIVSGNVVGTASLHGRIVRSVYVDPDHQGTGIGAKLMEAVERVAKCQSISRVSVPSSITAEGFYRSLGFTAVGEQHHGDERTIVMEKTIGA